MRFLIAGFPRSRTAWFSALCNTLPDTICLHEPCWTAGSWKGAIAQWNRVHPENIGLSDPTLSLHIGDIIREFSPRVLWIDRDKEDVDESLEKIGFGGTEICAVISDLAKPFIGGDLVLRVPFESLRDDDVVALCLDHLIPNVKINMEVIAQFQRLNIQVAPERTTREVNLHSDNIRSILGDVAMERFFA
jgi:hypothetical protein